MTKAESVRVALAARLAKPAQTRGKRWVHLKHRPALVAAWNGLCGLCDEPMVDHLSVPGVPRALWLTIDHIDPGGSDDIDNLRIVHASCNSARGNRAAITRVPPPWVRNPAHRSTAWVKVSR
jgi:5-methylcytosine-specific restriction endonuclease McrA